MTLESITREAVLAAVEEYDRLGRDAFLAKYGFGPAREYFLEIGGRLYDSKAICGAARGFVLPERGPLSADEFSGGRATVEATLTGLGFRVERIAPTDVPAVERAFAPGRPTRDATFNGDEAIGEMWEGAVTEVRVNRYERDRRARSACIAAHGPVCAACGIDFGERYGDFADGFIHVHHVTPISHIGETYKVDPEMDLVPVCPNCHAMLHYKVDAPRSVEELRQMLGR